MTCRCLTSAGSYTFWSGWEAFRCCSPRRQGRGHKERSTTRIQPENIQNTSRCQAASITYTSTNKPFETVVRGGRQANRWHTVPSCHRCVMKVAQARARQRHSVSPATAGQVSLLQQHSIADAQGWCLFGRACDQVVGAHLRAQYHLASSWTSRALETTCITSSTAARPLLPRPTCRIPHASTPPTAARPLLAQPASPPHTKHPAPHIPQPTSHIPHPTPHPTSHMPHSIPPTHTPPHIPHHIPHHIPPTHTPPHIPHTTFHSTFLMFSGSILDVFLMCSGCILDVLRMCFRCILDVF